MEFQAVELVFEFVFNVLFPMWWLTNMCSLHISRDYTDLGYNMCICDMCDQFAIRRKQMKIWADDIRKDAHMTASHEITCIKSFSMSTDIAVVANAISLHSTKFNLSNSKVPTANVTWADAGYLRRK